MNRFTPVKMCGLRAEAEAALAAELGVSAIGLVFYPPSPRYVGDLGLARAIAQAAGPLTTVVGLFVDATPAVIEQHLREVPLNLLQFHGDEPPAFCRQFNRPYLKALRMKTSAPIAGLAADYADARGILLDAYQPGVPGGTGHAFDWRLIPSLSQPLILAGGLDSQNVQLAIAQVKPAALDVSGGVESSRGQKDPAMMRAFMAAVRQAAHDATTVFD
jgi:phosphoribosylanthranilate isomerase